MNTETMKLIAELAYPNAKFGMMFAGVLNFVSDGHIHEVFNPQTNPEQELKLIRMYREWLDTVTADNGEGYSFKTMAEKIYRATESTETLLEAIARDML